MPEHGLGAIDGGSLNMLMKYLFLAFCSCTFLLSGCENTDFQTATEAGMDAVKALTFSDRDAQALAAQTAQYSDQKKPACDI